MSIEYRQWNQARRIQHGMNNGQLTQRETQALQSQQQEIRGAVKSAQADGSVNSKERELIRQLQDQASKDIYEAKHNAERQPGAPKIPGTPVSPTDTRRIDAREERQAQRIQNGISQGDLDLCEARRLEAQQQRIHGFEAAAMADGSLSNAERFQLERMQDNASRAIFLARHNEVPRRPFVVTDPGP